MIGTPATGTLPAPLRLPDDLSTVADGGVNLMLPPARVHQLRLRFVIERAGTSTWPAARLYRTHGRRPIALSGVGDLVGTGP